MRKSGVRLGIVMDPIEAIKPAKDSSFAMLLEAQARGWQLLYMLQGDIRVRDGEARAHARPLRVRDQPADWFDLDAPQDLALGSLDIILMRKDPPFDMEYVYSTYLLERAEQAGALVVNRPAALRDINEKVSIAWFADCTPPTLITREAALMREFLAEQGRMVIKPLDGMGGRSIFVIADGDRNRNVIIETLTGSGSRYAMAQAYLPEIVTAGDKRVLLIDGEPVPFALARIPAPDENRGNLVMGARGEGRELTDRDRWICSRVGPVLKDRGVLFAGLDVIGDYLTEINVTSPTGAVALKRFTGIDATDVMWGRIEALRGNA
ncbi:MAG TPA: glutathione synthase [Gammaproteobacteria bacterium]|nr:glutathione synthase [Gammaproteobacteria bacterium]